MNALLVFKGNIYLKKINTSFFLITSLFMKADDTIKLPEDNENKLWQTTEHPDIAQVSVYLKYDHEIESAVMIIYTSNIHNKFELYKEIQENVTISDAQIEKIAVENKKNPNLKMVDSKTSSGIPYKSITISGDKDEFFLMDT